MSLILTLKLKSTQNLIILIIMFLKLHEWLNSTSYLCTFVHTTHIICEVERFQLSTILAMCMKHPQLAGFLLTQNRSSFPYVERSTAWLYDCPYHLTPIYIVEQCYDKIAVNCLETVMYIDPITRKIFGYANQSSHGNMPQNVIVLLILTLINIIF